MEETDQFNDEAEAAGEIVPVVSEFCPAGKNGAGDVKPLVPTFINPLDETDPFPNIGFAVFDDTETGIRLDFKEHIAAKALNQSDGFGTFAPFIISFSGEIDADSLPATPEESVKFGSPVFLIRTDKPFPEKPDIEFFKSIAVPIETFFNKEDGFLVAYPLVPLDEKSRYALVVTRCVTAQGKEILQADAMSEIGELTGVAEAEMERILNVITRPDFNLPLERTALILPVVTRSVTSQLKKVRENTLNGPVQEAMIDHVLKGTDETGSLNPEFFDIYPGLKELFEENIGSLPDYDFTGIDVVVIGRFKSGIYFSPDYGFLGGNEGTMYSGVEEIKFFMMLPTENPQKGIVRPFPVVVFQHPFSVCKEVMIALAATFQKFGLAVIGIDAFLHGDRAKSGKWECPIDPMDFMDVSAPEKMSANFMGSLSDIIQFGIFVKKLDIDYLPYPDGDGANDIDTSSLGLLGMSMGANMTAAVAGVSEEFENVVINVGGAGVSFLFGAGFLGLNQGVDENDFSWKDFSRFSLSIMAPLQVVLEPPDPVNYAGGYFSGG
ncbi:MAG: hypothetical protein FJ088_03340, partial [Deltaproteobacteria bacterium]|nr:hypothetical protein [Deltaproteobacteria bacterium]